MKVDGVFVGCVCHECMLVVYAFFMQINVYTLLCMHCHGYGYACMVSQTCIVRSVYAISIIMMLLACYDSNKLLEIE